MLPRIILRLLRDICICGNRNGCDMIKVIKYDNDDKALINGTVLESYLVVRSDCNNVIKKVIMGVRNQDCDACKVKKRKTESLTRAHTSFQVFRE